MATRIVPAACEIDTVWKFRVESVYAYSLEHGFPKTAECLQHAFTPLIPLLEKFHAGVKTSFSELCSYFPRRCLKSMMDSIFQALGDRDNSRYDVLSIYAGLKDDVKLVSSVNRNLRNVGFDADIISPSLAKREIFLMDLLLARDAQFEQTPFSQSMLSDVKKFDDSSVVEQENIVMAPFYFFFLFGGLDYFSKRVEGVLSSADQ